MSHLKIAHQLWQKLLLLIFSTRCLCCKEQVGTINTICHTCWNRIIFITGKTCKTCSQSIYFDYHHGDHNCQKNRKYIKEFRAATVYTGSVADLIHQFKYEDKTQRVVFLTQFLLQAYNALESDIDIVIPVPLHNNKLKKRGYNQSALLAKELANNIKKQYDSDILLKDKDTINQMNLSQSMRYKNLKGAFYILKKNRNKINGKNILLVDDVVTTGTTIRECAKILLKANARNVSVVSIARTAFR